MKFELFANVPVLRERCTFSLKVPFQQLELVPRRKRPKKIFRFSVVFSAPRVIYSTVFALCILLREPKFHSAIETKV